MIFSEKPKELIENTKASNRNPVIIYGQTHTSIESQSILRETLWDVKGSQTIFVNACDNQ